MDFEDLNTKLTNKFEEYATIQNMTDTNVVIEESSLKIEKLEERYEKLYTRLKTLYVTKIEFKAQVEIDAKKIDRASQIERKFVDAIDDMRDCMKKMNDKIEKEVILILNEKIDQPKLDEFLVKMQ